MTRRLLALAESKFRLFVSFLRNEKPIELYRCSAEMRGTRRMCSLIVVSFFIFFFSFFPFRSRKRRMDLDKGNNEKKEKKKEKNRNVRKEVIVHFLSS